MKADDTAIEEFIENQKLIIAPEDSSDLEKTKIVIFKEFFKKILEIYNICSSSNPLSKESSIKLYFSTVFEHWQFDSFKDLETLDFDLKALENIFSLSSDVNKPLKPIVEQVFFADLLDNLSNPKSLSFRAKKRSNFRRDSNRSQLLRLAKKKKLTSMFLTKN